MENMENIEKDSVDKAADALQVMAKSNAELQEKTNAIEVKMDEILKSTANMNKALIRTTEQEKEVGKYYSFSDAANDVAKGKTAIAPYWDSKTTASFNSYVKMLANKDAEGIQKAFGDNSQGAADWTPTEFRSELVRLAFVQSVMLPKVTIMPMSRDKMDMPAPSGDLTWGFVDAGASMVDSNFTAGKLTLDTAKAYGLVLINKEDLEDPAYPLASYVAAKLGEDYARFVDKVILYGATTGSDAWDGKFAGWGSNAQVNVITGAVDATPTFAELITLDNLNSVIAELDEQEIEGAEFIMSMPAYNAVRNLKGSSGNPLVPINSAYDFDLLGFPITKTARCISIATAEEPAVFFGNPKHIYFGDRMDMSIATSEHYRFAEDQIVFRALSRFAVVCGIPKALVKLVFGAAS